MRTLIIDDTYEIDTPLIEIVEEIRRHLTNGKLKVVELKTDKIHITCPHHKEGKEADPSCDIYIGDNLSVEYGVCHCFTCGYVASFWRFVGECFDRDENYGKKWLIERYGSKIADRSLNLQPIELFKKSSIVTAPCKKLSNLSSFHPYMRKRKLSVEICEKFHVQYEPSSQSIVFPVWDIEDKLLFYTRRSVNTKMFLIPPNVDKPVYLLNFIQKEHINKVIVCESQINALYCWTLGYPAIALFGTGSSTQYSILNDGRKCSIKEYILAFDGDEAGDKGAQRFMRNIRKDVFVRVLHVPRGKDMNDLSKEEIDNLVKE